jgi:hypothetical protein
VTLIFGQYYPPAWGRYTTIYNGTIVDIYLQERIQMQIVESIKFKGKQILIENFNRVFYIN